MQASPVRTPKSAGEALCMTDTLPADLIVRPATPEDRPTVERLWPMFRHDLSEFRGVLPGVDGTFRSEWLVSAFTAPGWAPYLMTWGERPAGFAFVRGLDGPVRVLNSFFVVRGARRPAGRSKGAAPAPRALGDRVPA